MGAGHQQYLMETDEYLATQSAKGSAIAFEVLYERYAQKMFSYFYRMLWKDREKAEDMVQELFSRVFQHAHKFAPERNFSTWMYSIAHNLCKNEYRKAEVAMKRPANKEPTETVIEKNSDLQRFKQAVQQSLAALSEEKRYLYLLRFEEQLSVPVISQLLNIPEGTVKSRIFHLLKDLKLDLMAFKNLTIYP